MRCLWSPSPEIFARFRLLVHNLITSFWFCSFPVNSFFYYSFSVPAPSLCLSPTLSIALSLCLSLSSPFSLLCGLNMYSLARMKVYHHLVPSYITFPTNLSLHVSLSPSPSPSLSYTQQCKCNTQTRSILYSYSKSASPK